jgi:hypothetical protein
MRVDPTPHLIPPITPLGKVAKAKTKKKSEFQEILDKIELGQNNGQKGAQKKETR